MVFFFDVVLSDGVVLCFFDGFVGYVGCDCVEGGFYFFDDDVGLLG